MISVVGLMLVLLSAAVAPATTSAPSLGTARYLPVRGEDVFAALAGPGHLRALVARGTAGLVVFHQDRTGAWRSFPMTYGDEEARLAMLEDGRELVAYQDDNTHSVLVQTWGPDGSVTSPQAVLESVASEDDTPAWQMSADGSGTVVIASTGDTVVGDDANAGGIYATVRDPGSAFSSQVTLQAPTHDTRYDGNGPEIVISPIAADGSATVRWLPLDGGAGEATSRGRGQFVVGAPQVSLPTAPGAPLIADLGLTSLSRVTGSRATLYVAGSERVVVGSDVLALCRAASGGCWGPQLLGWTGGVRALVFLGDNWYVARPDRHGVFSAPALATRGWGTPVADPVPGVVDFAVGRGEFSPEPIALIPFGVVPAPRSPQVSLDPIAYTQGDRLQIVARCLSACRVTAMIRAPHHPAVRAVQSMTSFERHAAWLDPLEGSLLQVPAKTPGAAATITATVIATDRAGHTQHLVRDFRRSTAAGQTDNWCMAGAHAGAGQDTCPV
jgi:hypothetical protein